MERGRIQEVIISEGVGYATVTYYLAIMTRGDAGVVYVCFWVGACVFGGGGKCILVWGMRVI